MAFSYHKAILLCIMEEMDREDHRIAQNVSKFHPERKKVW